MGRTAKARRDRYGAWLHQLRTKRELTQEKLAKLLGVPRTTLAYWERSGNLTGRRVILQMAKILRVSLKELLRQKKA